MCNCNSNSNSNTTTSSLITMNCSGASSTAKYLKLSDNAFIITQGSLTKGEFSLCDYKEEITEFASTETTLTANSSKQILLSGNKVILLRFIYDDSTTIDNQYVFYRYNTFLRNPITGETQPNFVLTDSFYTSPTSGISLSDTIVVSDIITIAGITFEADVDFAVDVTPSVTITNLVSAINAHTSLSPYIVASYSAPNLIITALKPYKSYTLITLNYTPIGVSSNAPLTPTLQSNVLVDDSYNIAHEWAMINTNLNTLIDSLTLYNFSTTDIIVKILTAN